MKATLDKIPKQWVRNFAIVVVGLMPFFLMPLFFLIAFQWTGVDFDPANVNTQAFVAEWFSDQWIRFWCLVCLWIFLIAALCLPISKYLLGLFTLVTFGSVTLYTWWFIFYAIDVTVPR
jgi:hypothetical protein